MTWYFWHCKLANYLTYGVIQIVFLYCCIIGLIISQNIILYKIILFCGHEILWFDDDGHVRGHLNSGC